MVCISCLKNKEPDGCFVCNACYKSATGIDRETGKVDFRYSKDFKNPYAVESILETEEELKARKQKEQKSKRGRKKIETTTSTEYAKMKEYCNPVGGTCDCSDLSLTVNRV